MNGQTGKKDWTFFFPINYALSKTAHHAQKNAKVVYPAFVPRGPPTSRPKGDQRSVYNRAEKAEIVESPNTVEHSEYLEFDLPEDSTDGKFPIKIN